MSQKISKRSRGGLEITNGGIDLLIPRVSARNLYPRPNSTQFWYHKAPILLLLLNRKCCILKNNSPDSSLRAFGDTPRSWDTKNRSSHTQIIHIEILRAQMYLKSDETEGNLLPEHMNIFARNRLLAPKGEC